MNTTTTTTSTASSTSTITEIDFQSNESHNTSIETEASDDYPNADTLSSPPTPHTDFDASQCLFCSHPSPSFSQNLLHMSASHGLYINPTSLSAPIPFLLAYLHRVIFTHYTCLYCGTARSSSLAAQQHMAAKGHCKYDITGGHLELGRFFDSSEEKEEVEEGDRIGQRDRCKRAVDDEPHAAPSSARRKGKAPKRPERRDADTATSPTQPAALAHMQSPTGTDTGSGSPTTSPLSLPLTPRALKQASALQTHLSQLRATDQRSLAHLPAAEQRALLLAHHKQTGNARRSEQRYKGNLEGAGNKFGCLGKIRLVRTPPHFGNVGSLSR
jgi:pre-60S factor REI1